MKTLRFYSLLPLLILSLFVPACSSDDDTSASQQAAIAAAIFSTDVTQFNINVFYETGADPYTGTIGLTSNNVWDVTKESYEALFQNHTGRTVSAPMTLGAMNSFTARNKTSWTAAELIALGNELAPTYISGTVVTMPVIFVKGTLNDDTTILGVHFSGTPYAFIFKDVIVSVGGVQAKQRYVEQATVIHEIGHAVGLVNNGVPMVTNHEDASHAHHTTNDECVMYWAVESAQGISNIVDAIIGGNPLNLFGTESLQDGRNYLQ